MTYSNPFDAAKQVAGDFDTAWQPPAIAGFAMRQTPLYAPKNKGFWRN